MPDTTDVLFTDQAAPPPVVKPPAGAVTAPVRRPPRPADDPRNAPHGWLWDSKAAEWRPRKPPGRPRSAPRVQKPAADPPPSAAGRKPAKPAVNHRQTVMDVAEVAWLGMSTLPVPDKAFGYDLTGVRVRLRMQAAVLQQTAPSFAEGLATIAEHAPKSFLARRLDSMAEGKGGLWILPAAMLMVPLAAATVAVWTAPIDPDAYKVAEGVEAEGRDYFARMGEQMAEAMSAGVVAAAVVDETARSARESADAAA